MTLNLDDKETSQDFDAFVAALYLDRTMSPAHKAALVITMTGETRCEDGEGNLIPYLDFFRT